MANSRIAAVARTLLAGVMAVLVTAVLSSLVQTQFTVSGLQAVSVPVSLGQRLAMSAHDLLGFAPVYAGIVAGGFVIAFLVTAGLRRLHPFHRVRIHALAGAVAMLTALLLMNHLLGLALIPATLHNVWLALLVLCGALGGAVYARLSQ